MERRVNFHCSACGVHGTAIVKEGEELTCPGLACGAVATITGEVHPSGVCRHCNKYMDMHHFNMTMGSYEYACPVLGRR